MRILTLDLRTWGHFAGRTLAFPNQPAVHLVVGPNQAGKSTARRAFLSMLEGIGEDDALPVALPGAELGAKVLVGGQEHDVQRLGRIDRGRTWLGANGRPLADTVGWMPIARDVYAAVFCLDREGLDRSGRELARSDGELGSLFFAAGIGADVLASTRASLHAQKDKLFSPNLNAKKPEVNAASARLRQANEDLRNHQVLDIVARVDAVNAAEARKDDLATLRRGLERQSMALAAARDAVPQVDALREAEQALALIQTAGPLPDVRWVESARREETALHGAEQAVREAEEARGLAEEALAALPEDAEALAQATVIDALRGRTALVDGAAKELPALTVARTTAEASLTVAAQGAGRALDKVEPDALDALRAATPTPERIATARQVLARRVSLEDRVRQAQDALAAARITLIGAVKARDGAAPPTGVRTVREALEAARALGDIERELASSTREITRRRERVAAEFDRLRLPPCEARSLRALSPPSPEQVAAEVAAADAHDARRHRARLEEGAAHTAIRSAEARILDIRATEQAPDLATLGARRAERDTGVAALIEAQEGHPAALVDWSPTPGPALRAAVKEADDVADQRFASAEAVTQLALAEASLVHARVLQTDAALRLAALAVDEEQAAARWRRMLAERGLPAVAVREAARWRTDVLALGESLSEVEAAEALLAERTAAKGGARDLLSAALGEDGRDAASWTALLRRAEAQVRAHEAHTQARANLVGRVEAAETAVEAGERELARHQRALDEWTAGWAALPETLVLPQGASPAAGDLRVAACEQLHTAMTAFDAAYQAWKRAADTVSEFEAGMQEVRALADERLPARAALDVIDTRLQAAVRRNQERGVVTGRIGGHAQQIQLKTTAAAAAQKALDALRNAAGLSPGTDLQPIFDRVEAANKLDARISDLRRSLPRDRVALEAAIAGRTAAALSDEFDLVRVQHADAETEWQPALEQLVKARQRRDEVSGLDTAARDAERCAAIGAELAARVQEYLEEAAATWLLEQAIQDLADEASDGPLRRASERFAELTDGAFAGLEAWSHGDEGKSVQYVCARRANGERLSPDQLSDGTRDQLWLALRIAVIEDHLDRGIVAPVVFDDVLVNVDDGWAAALFRVLNALAQRTQVLMFTHHQHLVDVARSALGDAELSVDWLAARDPGLPRTGTTPVTPARGARAARQPAPQGERPDDAGDERAVLQYIVENSGSSRGDVTAALGISDAEWTAAISVLRESGQVRQEGIKRGARYFVGTSGG